MNFETLIQKNRSYRRFDESKQVSRSILVKLIEYARLTPSAKNLQALKFSLITDKELCARIFPALKWAGYLPDWSGPVAGERPTAYIVLLADGAISTSLKADFVEVSLGMAAQSILLGAVESGLGGCYIASINKVLIRQELKLEAHLEIMGILALGFVAEEVKIVEMQDSVEYYRDSEGVHYVPKRSVDDLIVK